MSSYHSTQCPRLTKLFRLQSEFWATNTQPFLIATPRKAKKMFIFQFSSANDNAKRKAFRFAPFGTFNAFHSEWKVPLLFQWASSAQTPPTLAELLLVCYYCLWRCRHPYWKTLRDMRSSCMSWCAQYRSRRTLHSTFQLMNCYRFSINPFLVFEQLPLAIRARASLVTLKWVFT